MFRSGRSFASNLGGVDDEMDTTSSSRPYVFPAFYRYPPYFTVQPVAETFQKQRELWSSLILSYCTYATRSVIRPASQLGRSVEQISDETASFSSDVWEEPPGRQPHAPHDARPTLDTSLTR